MVAISCAFDDFFKWWIFISLSSWGSWWNTLKVLFSREDLQLLLQGAKRHYWPRTVLVPLSSLAYWKCLRLRSFNLKAQSSEMMLTIALMPSCKCSPKWAVSLLPFNWGQPMTCFDQWNAPEWTLDQFCTQAWPTFSLLEAQLHHLRGVDQTARETVWYKGKAIIEVADPANFSWKKLHAWAQTSEPNHGLAPFQLWAQINLFLL